MLWQWHCYIMAMAMLCYVSVMYLFVSGVQDENDIHMLRENYMFREFVMDGWILFFCVYVGLIVG